MAQQSTTAAERTAASVMMKAVSFFSLFEMKSSHLTSHFVVVDTDFQVAGTAAADGARDDIGVADLLALTAVVDVVVNVQHRQRVEISGRTG